MKSIFIGFLISLTFSYTLGQMKIPLTRNDSGVVQENEVLYQKFLKQGDKKEASRYLDNTALLYWKHNHYNKAIQYYQESLVLNEQLQNYSGVAGINSNLAMIYADKGDHKNAYDYFEKTLTVRKAQKEKVGIISTLINESVVLNNLKKYDQSATKLKEALSLAREMNDLKQMRSCYGMLAETYQKAGDLQKSMYYYDFFKKFNEHVSEKDIQKSKQDLKSEQLKKELAELEVKNKELLLSQKNIELTNKENIIGKISQEQSVLMDSLTKQELSLEVVKQKHEIANLENEKLTAEKHRQNLTLIFVSIALLITVFAAVWVYRVSRQKTKLNGLLKEKNLRLEEREEELKQSNEELQQITSQLKEVNIKVERRNKEITAQHEELLVKDKQLEEQHEELKDSIRYALRIQTSILPLESYTKKIMPENFIFYKPKDVVSGDFYWINKVQDKIFIAAVDCTGHGVPGAFMSVVGHTQLNNIILKQKESDPGKILNLLDKAVRQSLQQEQAKSNDGMDMTLICLDQKNNQILAAGAHNNLYHSRDNELITYKANRFPIGGTQFEDKKFTTHTIDLQEGDAFYMFSDGFQDQFGGEKDKKFKRKNLLRLLQANENDDLAKMNDKLESAFQDWKRENEQTDDILVIGIRIHKNYKLI